MKNIILASLCVALSISACNQPKKTDDNTVTENKKDSVSTTPDIFYKRLEGTIGDKLVIINLHKSGDDYNGNYYANGSWMELLTDSIIDKNHVILFENNNPDYYFDKDLKQPRLDLTWVNKVVTGKWISGKKNESLAVNLEEKYPDGSFAFSLNTLQDSVKAFPKKEKSPMAHITFNYLLPTKADRNGDWLNNELKKINDINSDEDLLKALQKQSATYLKGYQDDIKSVNTTGDDGAWMNYTDVTTQNVQFNDKGFVIINNFTDNYSGGAHGNYNSNFYCFDVKNQKKLALGDLIKIDSNSLQKIVEKNLRKNYNIKPSEQLTTVLFENFLKPNKNFYFNTNGIAFMYNPYEVASYAQGQIVVFIPYADLKGYLNVDFMQRMK